MGVIMGVVLLTICGLALVIGSVLYAGLPRARQRRELARRRRHPEDSEESLQDFIRRVDQVTAADQLDHLDKEKGGS